MKNKLINMNNYGKAFSYEILIRRAFKCERGKHGAEVSLFENFMDSEESQRSFLPPIDKQREKIRTYIEKALDKFMKRKPTDKERSELAALQTLNQTAQTAQDFLNVIDKSLEVTHRYRDL